MTYTAVAKFVIGSNAGFAARRGGNGWSNPEPPLGVMPGTGNSTNGTIAGPEVRFPKKLYLHPSSPPDKKMKLTMAKNLKVVNKQLGVIPQTMPSK